MILFLMTWYAAINIPILPSPDDILGYWMSPGKDAIVMCYKEGNIYNGKVVWFKQYHDGRTFDSGGLPESKWMNAKAMYNFTYRGHEWENGTIWNISNGKKYSAYLTMPDVNKLNVVGYVYFKIFSETMEFTRYPYKTLPKF